MELSVEVSNHIYLFILSNPLSCGSLIVFGIETQNLTSFSLLFQDLNSQDQDEDPMNKLKGQKIVSCRICKGDHWTTRCPYKDTLGPMQKELAEQLGLSTGEKEKTAGEVSEQRVRVRRYSELCFFF